MDRKTKPYLLLLLFITIGFSCKKSQPSSPPFSPGTDVYMAGTANDSAVYWKNGQLVQLSANGKATGITVSPTGDVYVSGTVDSSSGAELAVYWKNGVRINLTDTGTATTDGIALADTNVYVSGFLLRNNHGNLSSAGAVYWKNGARINLTNCGPLDASDAAGLAVSRSDVYVAGFILMDTADYDTAVIWKNGVLVPNLYTTEGNAFYSIVFNGSDMYVAGESGGYLKNGVLVPLPQGFMIMGLAISGQDVYAIGSASTQPVGGFVSAYWKNGNLVKLFADTVSSEAIAVTGNDVYIVGAVYNYYFNKSAAVYWKNGVRETLAASGTINAITIVPN